ncbi:MAG: pyruvate kinase [Clostridia bacterium]|nr:pyruvate kinase [Clostridia bacterium]
MRKTKIICTLGPSTQGATLRDLAENGMNVARLNFSHGNHQMHKANIDAVKALRDELDIPIGIMLDTKGPEIRIGSFTQGSVTLREGARFTLTTQAVEGNEERVSVTYSKLPREVEIGTQILADDGLIELRVEQCTETDVVCTVVNGGVLSNNKSINLPGVHLSMPYMSARDEEDIAFGAKEGVDIVAASFTRHAADILEVRRVLKENNAEDTMVIAKIENRDGVDNIDEIIAVSDGVMVARGDMGVEIAIEELPWIQKTIIKKCYAAGKVAITATQMLDSMIHNPRPTRAEVTDVANAVYDGTSAIMLSGETAAGKYPLESLLTMARIAKATERSINYNKRFLAADLGDPTVTNAIGHATAASAIDLGASAIITVTQSGYSARMVSKYRPYCPIIAPTTSRRAYYKLALSWGVLPLMNSEKQTLEELFEGALECAKRGYSLREGDIVVMTGGNRMRMSGSTNVLMVARA